MSLPPLEELLPLLPPRVVAPPEREPLLELLDVVARLTWLLLLLLGRATLLDLSLMPEVLRLTCGVAEVLREVLELLRVTCGVADEVLRLVLELLRLTCGVAEVLRLVLELLLRVTCGVAELLRLVLELLRLTVGAVEVF